VGSRSALKKICEGKCYLVAVENRIVSAGGFGAKRAGGRADTLIFDWVAWNRRNRNFWRAFAMRHVVRG